MNYHIILVSPGVPENIGFVCRNIKTMAMTQLHLVNPCKNWERGAKITAYQAHDVLENAQIHDSLETALIGMDLIVGTTAQHRTTRKDAFAASDLPQAIENSIENDQATIALVFGSEESGLSTDDLKLCDWVSHIPIATTYPSLNLSHAVMVYAYECSKLQPPSKKEKEEQAPSSLRVMKEKTQAVLQWLEVEEHPVLYQRIKDRLMLLSVVDQKLLLSLFRFVQRKMKKKS